MNTKCSISAISAAIVIALTSGCGGGGGGGSDSSNNEEAPRQQTRLQNCLHLSKVKQQNANLSKTESKPAWKTIQVI